MFGVVSCKVGFVAELVIWSNISHCFYIVRSNRAKLSRKMQLNIK